MPKRNKKTTASQPTSKKITTPKEQVKGKTTHELMQRQLKDKNAVITDEEFRNIMIETDVDAQTSQEPLDIPVEKDRPRDEKKDHTIITPWDVISE